MLAKIRWKQHSVYGVLVGDFVIATKDSADTKIMKDHERLTFWNYNDIEIV